MPQTQIITALEDAEAQPKWPVDSLFDDVYEQMPYHLQKQKAELLEHTKHFGSEYPSLGPSAEQ